MPSEEDIEPILTFHEYPGGPPITFRDRYLQDDLDPEPVQQRSYVPRWIVMQGPVTRGAVPVAANLLISRELALAAARQSYFRYKQADIDAPWHYKIPERKAFIAHYEPESVHPATIKILHESGLSESEKAALENRIKFLEAQLESQTPHLQLYRLGAGSFLVAAISIVVWLLTGAGIPFHPIFAAGVLPISLGVMAMAFLARPTKTRPME